MRKVLGDDTGIHRVQGITGQNRPDIFFQGLFVRPVILVAYTLKTSPLPVAAFRRAFGQQLPRPFIGAIFNLARGQGDLGVIQGRSRPFPSLLRLLA
ncbi:MAG: hypothetical protein BWY09_01086 [Candidatus Hydrogenedentes bacterium ADurb.Bin179]|nr:MAG: hypothetical protein BWY09_01086 [Candidatus Hydrogenedentes bacterium ADurb.Bin179]